MNTTDTLRKQLIERARGGDLSALDVLLAGYPVVLPKAAVRAWRDARLREIYRALRAEDLQRSENFCINAIVSAVESVARSSTSAALIELSRLERDRLVADVGLVVSITPKMPGKTQLRTILVSSFTPIDTENGNEA